MADETLAHPLGRRDVLRLLGQGSVVASAAGLGLLSGCGSSDGPSERAGTTVTTTGQTPSTAGSTVPPFDPKRPYWLQGNFRPVKVESTVDKLEVTGTIPSELSGLFVRNGSNPPSGDSLHWFLGDGMLHGVRIDKGEAVWYRNRYIATPIHTAGKDLLDFGGIPGKENSQSNVALVQHGGRLLATGEVGWPYQIDASDLSTVGAFNFAGRLGDAMTAHPKIDPVTQQMHFFGYSFLEPVIRYYVADPDGTISHSTTIPVDTAVMIHDFAITDRDVVFWLGPVVFGPDKKALYPQIPFHWEPTGPSKVGVMPLGGSGDQIRWTDIDPCFVFHGLNAHRDGDEVVLNVHRLDEAFGEHGDLLPSYLTEWRIGTTGAKPSFSAQRISELPMDLPTHDRRHTGRATRHGWCATTTDPKGPFGMELAGICHIDTKTGHEDYWNPGDNIRAGEAVFIPVGDGEGEGYVTTYLWDRSTDRSALAFFDAQEMRKGPIAQVHLPVRVPFGFHGVWIDEAELT